MVTFEGKRKVMGGSGSGTPDGLALFTMASYDFFLGDIATIVGPEATVNERIEAAAFTFVKPLKVADTGHDLLKAGENAKDAGKGMGKDTLEVKFTKEQLATTPLYSPITEKWIKKGGTVKIDEDRTWVYTNKKGLTVRYPDGYPDFTEYAHPTVKPVEIEIASPTNRALDYKNANIRGAIK
ncbi:hypothetical protein PGC35_00035 [Psychrobacillus sp. PGGUH221]|uniref:hypothetical protein n=1 Tax=Psychrobacillus sp. PGGUH221 TaxID=3020058 RepID=UPI0035C6DEAC